MYRQRIPKRQQSDKTPYTAYNPHTIPLTERRWDDFPYHKVISIDPGTANFCIRVETRPKGDYGLITMDLYHRLTLTDYINEEMLCTTYDVLTQFLDQHIDLFLQCHMVIIERQLPINYRTVRISQHALTYFMIKLKNTPLLPLIMEVDPKLKSRELKAPPSLTESQLKKWSIDKATELLTLRQDQASLAVLQQSKKKRDDLADTVCQIEALFSYLGFRSTPQISKPYKTVLRIQPA